MRRRAEDYPFYDLAGPIAIAKKANSLAAIQIAQEAGISYVEFDVVDTADRKALISHDAKNKRDAERLGVPLTRVIQSMPLNKIRSKFKAEDEKLATLDEALSYFPDVHVYIDAKTLMAAFAVAKAVKAHRAIDRVSLGGYVYPYTKVTARLLGGQRNVPTSPGAFEYRNLSRSNGRLSRFMNKSEITSYHLADYQMTDEVIEIAQEAGVHPIVWAGPDVQADNLEYIERNLDRGVHGIMSERTEEMVRAFVDRGHTESFKKTLGGWATKTGLTSHL